MQGQNRFSVITILVVVFSILHSGEAIKCYGCISTISTSCANSPSSDHELNCPEGFPSCVKFTISTPNDGDVITRACAVAGFCKNPDPSGLLKTCEECVTNLCNASAKNAMAITTMIALGLALLFSRY